MSYMSAMCVRASTQKLWFPRWLSLTSKNSGFFCTGTSQELLGKGGDAEVNHCVAYSFLRALMGCDACGLESLPEGHVLKSGLQNGTTGSW